MESKLVVTTVNKKAVEGVIYTTIVLKGTDPVSEMALADVVLEDEGAYNIGDNFTVTLTKGGK